MATKKRLITRRQFVSAAATAATTTTTLLPLLLSGCGNTKNSNIAFLAAADDAYGSHFLVATDEQFTEVQRWPLLFRGHEVIVSKSKDVALLLGRRPSNQGILVQLKAPYEATLFSTSPGRHFYGHGCFSPSGNTIITGENDFKNGEGVLVERLTSTLQVVSECDSGGIGPHEFAWLSDGKTLAVANGGILTHPDKPRMKLNIDSMAPNLAIIDFEDKKVLESVPGKEPKASIRHLAVADNDLVIVGMQYEGSPLDRIPLVATYGGSDWNAMEMPAQDLAKMKQYTGSVCVDPATGYALVTSPRGHQLTFWDTREQQYLGKKSYRDISGLAFDSSSKCFFATTGLGKVYMFPIDSFLELNEQNPLTKHPNLKWDNHVTRV